MSHIFLYSLSDIPVEAADEVIQNVENLFLHDNGLPSHCSSLSDCILLEIATCKTNIRAGVSTHCTEAIRFI